MNEQLSGDIRALSKWLNEEPNEPIDRPALARVLHAIASADQSDTDAQELLRKMRVEQCFRCDCGIAGATWERANAVIARTQALATAEPVQAVTPTSGNILVDAFNEVQALKQHATTEPLQRGGSRGPFDGESMSAHRAAYFIRRFKQEEKLLGPNEQLALDFVLSMLTATTERAASICDGFAAPDMAAALRGKPATTEPGPTTRAEAEESDWRNRLTVNLLRQGAGLTKTQIRALISFAVDGVEPDPALFDTTERKGEPIGEIVRSFGAGSGLEVRLFGGLTSDTPGIVGTKLYTSPQVPPHILGLTQGITGALNHLVLMIAGRAKAFPSLPLGRYLPEALHFAGLEMPSREACRPMTFNVPTVSTLTSAIAGALSGTWHCMRVWEAWHHGTMSEDDFEPVAESETPREIAEIVAGMYALAQGGSLDEAEEVPSHG